MLSQSSTHRSVWTGLRKGMVGWRAGGVALGAGVLVAAALPPWGWWPLAFAGIALIDWLLADQPAWTRCWRGAVASIGCLAPSMVWIAAFTMPGYVIAVVFYSALTGIACVLCPPTAPGRWLALPSVLVLAEAIRSRWPFGGVPVSTFALGQVGGVLAPIARVGGPLLLGLVTVTAGVAVAAATRRHLRGAAAGSLIVVLMVVVAVFAPRGHDTRAISVAAVQGGGEQGTRLGDVDPRIVFERHVQASERIETPVDLVVWPEDTVDVDGPVEKSPEGNVISALASRLHATVLIGAVEGDVTDEQRFHNAQVAYGPDGRPIDRYEKVRRVPFGEFVPLRWLLEPIAGGQLIKRDALPGADPATLTTPAGTLGVVISWEVFFADRARAAVRDGGDVLVNPTNGASFEGSLVQAQQIASSRLRAIETGRWLVQAAPTGYSALITPTGRVVQRTSIGEQRVLQGIVELRSGRTIATRVGDWPALALSASGIGVGWLLARRRVRPRASA